MKVYQYSIFAACAAFSMIAEASNYPPGYAVERSCQTKGPVEVCAVNQHYGQYPRLNIYYKGVLTENNSSGKLNAWIQMNGRRGFYPFSDNTLLISEPVAYFCWVGGVPEGHEGPYAGCLYPTHTEPAGSIVWELNPIPQDELDLFFYARNQYGIGNAWDVELAFVNEAGQWDSNWSQNYRFRFE